MTVCEDVRDFNSELVKLFGYGEMSERRRSSLLSLIRGKSSKDAKKESVGFER